MALTSARQILNKKILGTGGVPSADEISIDIVGLSATKLSVGLEEIVLDINQLSASVLTIGEKVENATEYSTTEKVVGKWIDGSDIYEKTIDFGALPNATTKTVDHNIANLANVVELSGIAKSGSDYFPLPILSTSNVNRNVLLYATNTAVGISNSYDYSEYSATVIIKYTKTAAESKKKTTKKK